MFYSIHADGGTAQNEYATSNEWITVAACALLYLTVVECLSRYEQFSFVF